MAPLQHSEAVLKNLASQTQEVILFYSAGKDSIVCLDLCRKYFKRIVCVYMTLVEGLNHNRYLLNHVAPNELIEITHWITSHYLANNFMRYYKNTGVKKLKLKDIEAAVRLRTGINWIITGQKQSDSINRRVMLRQFENDATDYKGRRCHPLSHWKNSEVLNYIKLHKLPKPIEYAPGIPSQGVDLKARSLRFLKEHHPQDYQKILKVFPLAETVFL